VQLFKALAPLKVLQLERLTIDFQDLELGSPEVEALAHSLGDSINTLELTWCTLTGSFWRPLAQHFPNLQDLALGFGIETSVMDLRSFLSMRGQSNAGSLTIKIYRGDQYDTWFAELQAQIAASQLQNVHLVRF
jgi:hypothetical protein